MSQKEERSLTFLKIRDGIDFARRIVGASLVTMTVTNGEREKNQRKTLLTSQAFKRCFIWTVSLRHSVNALTVEFQIKLVSVLSLFLQAVCSFYKEGNAVVNY